jgi:hypothetical protein
LPGLIGAPGPKGKYLIFNKQLTYLLLGESGMNGFAGVPGRDGQHGFEGPVGDVGYPGADGLPGIDVSVLE